MDEPMEHVTYWTNPRTGVTYRVVPVGESMMMKGYNRCRRYRTTIMMRDHKVKHVYGTACRREDGTWVAVSSR